jgi:putative transposase
MGRPYSLDLRERVVSAMTAGMSGQQAAQHFSIGASSALRWARRARETGSPKAKPMGGTRPFVLEAHRRWITVRLAEKPDLTLRALAAELKARGAKGSSFAVWSIVADAGLSFKKTSSDRRSAYGGRSGSRYPEPEGSGRRIFGGLDPVKKRGPWAVADLRVVTPGGDPD